MSLWSKWLDKEGRDRTVPPSLSAEEQQRISSQLRTDLKDKYYEYLRHKQQYQNYIRSRDEAINRRPEIAKLNEEISSIKTQMDKLSNKYAIIAQSLNHYVKEEREKIEEATPFDMSKLDKSWKQVMSSFDKVQGALHKKGISDVTLSKLMEDVSMDIFNNHDSSTTTSTTANNGR